MNEKLLKKFLNDQCSPQEIERVKLWANDPDNKRQFLLLLEKKWEEKKAQDEPDFVYENLLRKISDRISENECATSSKSISNAQPPRTRYLNHSYYGQMAAAVAIFMIVATYFIYNFHSQPQNELSTATAYVTKSTSFGQKLTFRLPDGTTVVLNSASSIKYPERFHEGKREVSLSGEAFFDVVRDTASPFMVHSDNVTTTALGTSFNVKSAGNEIEVALTTGKVSIENQLLKSNPDEKVYLLPGEMAVYIPNAGNIRKENFDPAEVTGWKEGSIHFKSLPLGEIMKRLEQWYGVSIKLDNKISGDRKLTGKFNNENLESIIQGLSFSLGCNYAISGKNVEINK